MVAKRIITVVGCHAEGEQGDVITGGVLPPPGDTMMAKKVAFERDHDDIRRLLICEPRGSVARHVNLIVPSTRDDCAAGAIIMEPTEYPPMSGSNTMCIATVLLETGVVPMIEPETRFRLDMPAGPVDIVAECHARQVRLGDVEERAGVRLRPRRAARGSWPRLDQHRHLLRRDDLRDRRCGSARLRDRSRRGARPRCARRADTSRGARAAPRRPSRVARHQRRLDRAVRRTADREGDRVSARNTCIVSPGRSDRSPTGTGTTARMAVLHARGVVAGRRWADPLVDHRLASSTARSSARRRSLTVPGHRGDHPGQGLDHRPASVLRRCR